MLGVSSRWCSRLSGEASAASPTRAPSGPAKSIDMPLSRRSSTSTDLVAAAEHADSRFRLAAYNVRIRTSTTTRASPAVVDRTELTDPRSTGCSRACRCGSCSGLRVHPRVGTTAADDQSNRSFDRERRPASSCPRQPSPAPRRSSGGWGCTRAGARSGAGRIAWLRARRDGSGLCRRSDQLRCRPRAPAPACAWRTLRSG